MWKVIEMIESDIRKFPMDTKLLHTYREDGAGRGKLADLPSLLGDAGEHEAGVGGPASAEEAENTGGTR